MRGESGQTWPVWKILGAVALAAFFGGWLSAAGPVEEEALETCSMCHEDFAKAYAFESHAVIDPLGMAREMGAENSCAACHTGWERHLEEGGGIGTVLGFRDTEMPQAKSKACMACHSDTNARYFAGPHGKADLDCTTCHVIHGPQTQPFLLKASSNENCLTCHGDVGARFQLNERHRLLEGVLTCASCHNPHEPWSRERLGGFKDQACLKCHTAQGGPFLHEHGASRVEGCTACHEVHGSPNRHLLTHQSIADLCFSCHAAAPAWHARFDSQTSNCTTCHSTIHGSNLSRIFLK